MFTPLDAEVMCDKVRVISLEEKPNPIAAQDLLIQQAVTDLYLGLNYAADASGALDAHDTEIARLLGLTQEGVLTTRENGLTRFKTPEEIVISPETIDKTGLAEYLGRRALGQILITLDGVYQEGEITFGAERVRSLSGSNVEINKHTFAEANALIIMPGLYNEVRDVLDTLWLATVALDNTGTSM